jgi:hypothetical protein
MGTSPAAYFTLWGAVGETPAAYPALQSAGGLEREPATAS